MANFAMFGNKSIYYEEYGQGAAADFAEWHYDVLYGLGRVY